MSLNKSSLEVMSSLLAQFHEHCNRSLITLCNCCHCTSLGDDSVTISISTSLKDLVSTLFYPSSETSNVDEVLIRVSHLWQFTPLLNSFLNWTGLIDILLHCCLNDDTCLFLKHLHLLINSFACSVGIIFCHSSRSSTTLLIPDFLQSSLHDDGHLRFVYFKKIEDKLLLLLEDNDYCLSVSKFVLIFVNIVLAKGNCNDYTEVVNLFSFILERSDFVDLKHVLTWKMSGNDEIDVENLCDELLQFNDSVVKYVCKYLCN
ncbi:hypothetical protein GEMRC1_011560 [Eukaryota sp. GEM-RC1]